MAGGTYSPFEALQAAQRDQLSRSTSQQTEAQQVTEDISYQNVLTWLQNHIPVISYMLNKGHCRKCQAKIPPICFVSELACGTLGTVICVIAAIQI